MVVATHVMYHRVVTSPDGRGIECDLGQGLLSVPYWQFVEVRKQFASIHMRGRLTYADWIQSQQVVTELEGPEVCAVAVGTDDAYVSSVCVGWTHTIDEATSTLTKWMDKNVVDDDELLSESLRPEANVKHMRVCFAFGFSGAQLWEVSVQQHPQGADLCFV